MYFTGFFVVVFMNFKTRKLGFYFKNEEEEIHYQLLLTQNIIVNGSHRIYLTIIVDW